MKSALFLVSIFVVIWAASGFTQVPKSDPAPDFSGLEAASQAGDTGAKVQLAKALFRGQGIVKDASKAARLLEEAAGAGNVDAMDGLGYLYTLGEGVPKDESKAVEWFRKGAEAGLPKAQLNLGLMLRQGKSIELNNEESLKWIHKAAEEGGLVEAKAVLGRLYFTGDRLQKQDHEKSLLFLIEPAESGDPICQNMMGVFARDGVGLQKDTPAAQEWFRKAALKNDRKAQSNLAHSLGVESPASPNRKEALKWLLIASQQDEITAKKTYKEIEASLPSALIAAARKEADQFLVLQRAAAARKKMVTTSSPAEASESKKRDSLENE